MGSSDSVGSSSHEPLDSLTIRLLKVAILAYIVRPDRSTVSSGWTNAAALI
jgi:hypothetical protein